jgi:hypothetical protein
MVTRRGRSSAPAGGAKGAAKAVPFLACRALDGRPVALHENDICLLSYENLRT